MESETSTVSKKALWAGRIVSAVPILFLLMDSVRKLLKPAFVVEGTVKLGYRESTIVPLGIVLLTCVILYAVPQTSALGYLGGAVATHVRVGDPLFSHVLFPVYLGILIWLGLYLRDVRLRALVPLVSRT
jgi:hypothetical protein